MPQSSPETIPHLPAARVIRGKDPPTLLGLLGLGSAGNPLAALSVFDFGGLGVEVQNQGYQRRDVAGEPLHFPLWSLHPHRELAGSFFRSGSSSRSGKGTLGTWTLIGRLGRRG